MPKHTAPQIPVVYELSDSTGTVGQPLPLTSPDTAFTAQEVGVSIAGVFPSPEIVRWIVWFGQKDRCPIRQVTSFPEPSAQVVYDSHLGPFGGPNAVSVEQIITGGSITRFDAFKMTSSFLKISSDGAHEQGIWMQIFTSSSEPIQFVYSTYVKGYQGIHSRAGEVLVTEGNKLGPVSPIRGKTPRAAATPSKVLPKKASGTKSKKVQKVKKSLGKKVKKVRSITKGKKPGKTAVKDATKLAKFFKDLRAAKTKK